MCTVTVFPPFEYVGIAEARSGIALMLFGRYDKQRPLGGVRDLVGERVVRLARIDVVDVAGGEDGDRPARLPVRPRSPRSGAERRDGHGEKSSRHRRTAAADEPS